jgi:hypothetical protein
MQTGNPNMLTGDGLQNSPVQRRGANRMPYMYAFVWRRDGFPGIHWYIRCLGPDGFYGEVCYEAPEPRGGGRATGARGHFTAADAPRVATILADLSADGPTEPGPCFALLGRYTKSLGQGEVVFKYERGAEASCPRARLFLELYSIIEAYLGEAYAEIGYPGAVADGGSV